MSDVLYAGETWRRTVHVADGAGPVDPTDVTAVLCPEVRMTVTRLAAGAYEVSLDETETAGLVAGETAWQMWGRVGADMTMITRQPLLVRVGCGP